MGLTEELCSWSWEQKCRRAVANLEKNGFTARYCATPQEAGVYILEHTAAAATIGFGGSMSIADLQLAEELAAQGKELLVHGRPGLTPEERQAVMRRQLTCDLFLTGTNALTLSGWLVNIDATGNRVAAMLFGPQRVIVVAGRNKLVDGGIPEAMRRIKELATPPNARRLKFQTPCASTGFCSDCNAPDRLCRATTVLERRPRATDLHVLVVNADLGF